MKVVSRCLRLALVSILFCANTNAESSVHWLRAPEGYRVELFEGSVKGAREMTLSPQGTLFVGTREDKVYAIKDHKVYTIAKDLNSPNGVAFKDGALFVAEISRILRFDQIENQLAHPPKPAIVYDKFSSEKHHGWKFIAFGPDGYLYVPVGAPCNVCDKEKDDPRFASIMRFKKLDGSAPEIFASGIRNTVGFDWHPKTTELWFTDNGRDLMGDDEPADELNVASSAGKHFGFPFCHQGDLLDPEYGKKRSCSTFSKPELKFGAHVAVLGMRFLNKNQILIAQHGSWNRSSKSGYQVVEVTLKNGKLESKPWLSGFLQGNEVKGRPVDIEIMNDGSVLVSDDQAGAIYRVSKIKSR